MSEFDLCEIGRFGLHELLLVEALASVASLLLVFLLLTLLPSVLHSLDLLSIPTH